MIVKPIKKKKIYQEIIEQIQLAIKEEQLKPGDKLPSERTLAEKFKVSRTTIKEAITVMETMGMIDIRTGVGTFLRESNVEINARLNDLLIDNESMFQELMEFRQAIEVDSAYYAAIRGSAQDKLKLVEKYNDMEKAIREQRLSAGSDYSFHMFISSMCGNILFTKTMELISDRFFNLVTKNSVNTLAGAGNPKDVLEEHRAICEAILKGDGMEARRAMRQHLDAVINRYKKSGLLISQ